MQHWLLANPTGDPCLPASPTAVSSGTAAASRISTHLLYAEGTHGATALELPVAIIGAGPVGLAAAAHLVERKMPFVVFESGPRVGHSMLAWGHVQLFSPWQAPDPESYPTGRALVEQYLAPLALPIQRPVRVQAVRRGDGALLVESDRGVSRARAVVSATGTWTKPFIPIYPGQELFQGIQIH